MDRDGGTGVSGGEIILDVSEEETTAIPAATSEANARTVSNPMARATSNPTTCSAATTALRRSAALREELPRTQDCLPTRGQERESSGPVESQRYDDNPPPYPGTPAPNFTFPFGQALQPDRPPPYHSTVAQYHSPAPTNTRARGPATQTQRPVYLVQTATGRVVPLLPGQVDYNEAALRVAPPRRARHAEQTERVVQVPEQLQPARDHLGLSFLLLVCCTLQVNLPALLCVIVALAWSLKAQQSNHHGYHRKARRYGKAALMCNVIAIVEFAFCTAGIGATIAFFLVINLST